MVRKLLSMAGVLVAVASVTPCSSEVQARHCGRGHHRNRCCQQNGNDGCGQQSGNCGCQQAGSYAPAMTACCGQQSNSAAVQPVGFDSQRPYESPVATGRTIQPAPVTI